MRTTVNNLLARNSVFAWLALTVCVLLLIPLGAMQFTSAVNWGIEDFIAMGALLFVAGSALVLVARKVSPKRRLIVGALVAIAFLYVWAELAVGVFTNLGN